MPQEPPGSGCSSSPSGNSASSPSSSSAASSASSSSSASDLADSDERNDEDDDENENENENTREHRLATAPATLNSAGAATDQSARRENAYENIENLGKLKPGMPGGIVGRPLERLAAGNTAAALRESGCLPARLIDRTSPVRLYDREEEHGYTETALTTVESTARGLRDYSSSSSSSSSSSNGISRSSSSSSANSLDDLCRGHRRTASGNPEETGNGRGDQFMIPTRDPRELNERILSLFNPQFLPNFNDMIMYVAAQCDSRRSPPPRSRSAAEGEARFFSRSSSHRRKRSANSMFFKRGLTYDAARN